MNNKWNISFNKIRLKLKNKKVILIRYLNNKNKKIKNKKK